MKEERDKLLFPRLSDEALIYNRTSINVFEWLIQGCLFYYICLIIVEPSPTRFCDILVYRL